MATAQALPHHVLPESGWIRFYIKEPHDVEKAIASLRRSYDLVNKKAGRDSTIHDNEINDGSLTEGS